MRWQRMACAGAIVLATLVVVAGCSLGWEVRPDPGEGGAPDTSVADVAIVETGSDAGEDGPAEAEVDAACDTDDPDLAAARLAAKKCILGNTGQCTTSVTDECDCEVVVRTAGSSEATAFAAAAAARRASCGKSRCKSCPPLGVKTSWACLQPGTEQVCVP